MNWPLAKNADASWLHDLGCASSSDIKSYLSRLENPARAYAALACSFARLPPGEPQ
jgi:hypothetical protein